MDDLTAFILAGGKSSRMGRDKAFVQIEGVTLLHRALVLARTLTPAVWIVGDPPKFTSINPAIGDVHPGHGPLGGIHAALNASETDLNLILAVDLPFLETKFLEYLVAEARTTHATVTVPESGGRLHPLCAVYRRHFAGFAEKALLAGKNKIDLLFAEVETRVISQPELSRMGFSDRIFHNLNTLADVEALGGRA